MLDLVSIFQIEVLNHMPCSIPNLLSEQRSIDDKRNYLILKLVIQANDNNGQVHFFLQKIPWGIINSYSFSLGVIRMRECQRHPSFFLYWLTAQCPPVSHSLQKTNTTNERQTYSDPQDQKKTGFTANQGISAQAISWFLGAQVATQGTSPWALPVLLPQWGSSQRQSVFHSDT